MVCTGCGIVGADARPNWKEQPPRETLNGVQWQSCFSSIGTRSGECNCRDARSLASANTALHSQHLLDPPQAISAPKFGWWESKLL
jgi:hypothetical protein